MTNVSCHAGNEKLTSPEKLNINILSCLELKCFSRAFLLIRHYLIFSLGSLFISNAAVSQVYDYQTDYIQLESAIASNMNVPSEGANRVEPYLDAMKFKSGHRERAIMLYGAALADNSKSAPAFKALIDKARESGDLTADQSARWLLYIQPHKKHLAVGNLIPDQWSDVIARLKETGRRLLTESRKCGFRDALIIDRAACMIRYSVLDLEVGHFGLYDGREVVLGKFDDQGILDMPDRDFDIDCEQRIEFSQQQS